MIEKLKESLSKLENKDFQILFLTPDVKGTPRASIAEIYNHVKELINLGYKASILHEKNDYTKVGAWLGEEYDNLPHSSIEEVGGQLKVGPHDFMIIPELFGNVLQQIEKIPCKKIILAQSYDYILDMLPPGASWSTYGVNSFITTSETIKQEINKLFPLTNGHIVNPSIPSYFKNEDKLKKPIIAIMCRDDRTTSKIVKSFYLKYPLYSFITFRDIKNMSREDLAGVLNDYFLSVWIDETSSFGTFPIESMRCGTPVIGKVPTIQPEWISEKNGVWLFDELQIPEAIAIFCKNFFEDLEDTELLNEIKGMENKYTEEEQSKQIKDVYTKIFDERKNEIKTNISRLSDPNNLEKVTI
jgi:hypothetical protein